MAPIATSRSTRRPALHTSVSQPRRARSGCEAASYEHVATWLGYYR
jgi:hypothetical protein